MCACVFQHRVFGFRLLFMPVSDLENLPRPIARRLRTLGHALTRVEAALRLLPKRLERGLLDATSTAWIQQWAGGVLGQGHGQGQPSLASDEVLKATIAWQEQAWLVSELPPAWHGALLLLHLPVLRDFWRKELRAARYERLKRVLPKVWAKDPAPLPPGAVIAGLDIASWEDLPRLEAKGRTFVESASKASSEADPERTLVMEKPLIPASAEQLTLAWQREENGRVGLL